MLWMLYFCTAILLTSIHSCGSLSIGKGGVFSSKDCPHPCEQGGHKYCNPIPCPLPPCDDPVTTPGECCPHCPNRTECPDRCKIDGKSYCHSPGCPPPMPCRKMVLTPGDCCPHCESEEIQDDVSIGNKSCPYGCEINGNFMCNPPPCPPPPCKHPKTWKGVCCEWCLQEEDDQTESVSIRSDFKSTWPFPDPNLCVPPPPCPPPPPPKYCNGTIINTVDLCCEVCSSACPSRCRMYGNLWCTPSECPPLFCPNIVLTEGDCCPHCEM